MEAAAVGGPEHQRDGAGQDTVEHDVGEVVWLGPELAAHAAAGASRAPAESGGSEVVRHGKRMASSRPTVTGRGAVSPSGPRSGAVHRVRRGGPGTNTGNELRDAPSSGSIRPYPASFFCDSVDTNDEGAIPVRAVPFEGHTIARLREVEQLSPGAAAAIHLAWSHRNIILATR